MYSHCEVEQEILRSSHGPGVIALQRKPTAPAPGREKGWARREPPGEPLVLVTCVSLNIRQLGNLFPARCLP